MSKGVEPEIGFKADTGEVYMLNKRERILVREILRKTLRSTAGKQFIAELFGREGLRLAKSLFEEMEG
jgi:hypothetical protein